MVKTNFKIKIKAPAKINLTLKVGKKREDGFHPIESIMQTINLYDYITLEGAFFDFNKGDASIRISSNSNEIPHDSSNIAYKAAKTFLDEVKLAADINIYIEKNIPVCAGLAGGSTDAAAVIYGLNILYDRIFKKTLEDNKTQGMLSALGSDLNFCYAGGAKTCRGRGEALEAAEFKEVPITLIKPKNLKISAREAYEKFDVRMNKAGFNGGSDMANDLEWALLPCYRELSALSDLGFQMSGSGPTFFARKAFLEPSLKESLEENHIIIENLKTIQDGVLEV